MLGSVNRFDVGGYGTQCRTVVKSAAGFDPSFPFSGPSPMGVYSSSIETIAPVLTRPEGVVRAPIVPG